MDVYLGEARFVAPKVLQVGDVELRAERFVLAVGSRPRVPSVSGLDGVPYFTSDTIMRLGALPRSMVVLGQCHVDERHRREFRAESAEVALAEVVVVGNAFRERADGGTHYQHLATASPTAPSARPSSGPPPARIPSPTTSPSPTASPSPTPSVQLTATVSVQDTVGLIEVSFQVNDTGNAATGQLSATVTLPAGSFLIGIVHGHKDSGGWSCQPASGGASCSHDAISADGNAAGTILIGQAARLAASLCSSPRPVAARQLVP